MVDCNICFIINCLYDPFWEGFQIMDIRDILFWVFLAVSIGLLVWAVFGNSSTEFLTLAAIMFTILLKMWSISDRLLKLEMKFNLLAKDFKEHITHKK